MRVLFCSDNFKNIPVKSAGVKSKNLNGKHSSGATLEKIPCIFNFCGSSVVLNDSFAPLLGTMNTVEKLDKFIVDTIADINFDDFDIDFDNFDKSEQFISEKFSVSSYFLKSLATSVVNDLSKKRAMVALLSLYEKLPEDNKKNVDISKLLIIIDKTNEYSISELEKACKLAIFNIHKNPDMSANFFRSYEYAIENDNNPVEITRRFALHTYIAKDMPPNSMSSPTMVLQKNNYNRIDNSYSKESEISTQELLKFLSELKKCDISDDNDLIRMSSMLLNSCNLSFDDVINFLDSLTPTARVGFNLCGVSRLSDYSKYVSLCEIAKEVNALSQDILRCNNNNNFAIWAFFRDFKGVSDIESLTFKQKKILASKLTKLNRNHFGQFKSQFPFIPTSLKEYNVLIQNLNISSQKNIIKLPDAIIEPIKNNLNAIDTTFDTYALLFDFKNKFGDIFAEFNHDDDTIFKTAKALDDLKTDLNYRKLNEDDKNLVKMAIILFNQKNDVENSHLEAMCGYADFAKLGYSDMQNTKMFDILNVLYQNINLNSAEISINELEHCSFNLRKSNTFELFKIISNAISGYDASEIKTKNYNEIEKRILQIKQNQPFLPISTIPKASEIKEVEPVIVNGIKNVFVDFKYLDDDLSRYGFISGTTKENLYFLAHSLSDMQDILKVETFSSIDSDVLLSATCSNIPNPVLYDDFGLLLDVDIADICAAYNKNFGSGYSKTIETLFDRNYLFNNSQQINPVKNYYKYRIYVSNLIKEGLGINDSQYVDLIDKYFNVGNVSKMNFDDKFYSLFESLFVNDKQENNEILVLHPQIKGIFTQDSLEKLPEDIRIYASINNLAIFKI